VTAADREHEANLLPVPGPGDRMALLNTDGQVIGYWTVTEFLVGSSDNSGHARATVTIEFDKVTIEFDKEKRGPANHA
jgi:hypothetical protein